MMEYRLQGLAVMILQQVQKMSIIAKVFSSLILLFYGLSFVPHVKENLAVVPAYIGPPGVKLWTLVTATFYEKNIVLVILDIVAVIGFSSILEPLWSIKEFLLFSGVVSVTSLCTGVPLSMLLYAIFQSWQFLFVPYHGLVALACGYVVAVKQFYPDSVAFPPPAPPTLRVRHLPLLIVVIAIILACVKVVPFTFAWLAVIGTLTSWIYLRFYQKKEQDSRGDMAESFAFATFFPEPIQPPLATLGGFLFRVLVTIRVCSKTVRTYNVGDPDSSIKLSLPGTDPLHAQRRKQRALKALDERLSKVELPLSSWDDPGSSSSQDELSIPTPLTTMAQGTPHLEAVVVEKLPSSSSSSSHVDTKLSTSGSSETVTAAVKTESA